MTLANPNLSTVPDIGPVTSPAQPVAHREVSAATAVRQQRWLEENRGAIEDANRFLEKHGLWSDGKRLF